MLYRHSLSSHRCNEQMPYLNHFDTRIRENFEENTRQFTIIHENGSFPNASCEVLAQLKNYRARAQATLVYRMTFDNTCVHTKVKGQKNTTNPFSYKKKTRCRNEIMTFGQLAIVSCGWYKMYYATRRQRRGKK